jgi:hypothetical protein
MSMLIVEMKMPTKCPCDLANGDAPCFAAYGIPKRWADFEKHSKLLHTRPWWCPIKGELPDEHGDLIDRDELKKQCWHDDGFDLWVSHTEIDQQPTVIAAERKNE